MTQTNSIRIFFFLAACAALLVAVIPQSLFAAVTVYETQSKRDYYNVVQPDMRANGGVDETAAHGYPQYQINQVSPTGQRICYLYDPSAYPTNWSLGGFDSAGNNSMAVWNPAQSKWLRGSASSFGNKRYNYITCKTDEKADAALLVNGVSEVTINKGESVNLSWYSQYGSIRKATCTATNFSTTVSVPAHTQTTTVPNCSSVGFDLLSIVGFSCDGFTLNQTSIPASQVSQPFSGSQSVSPTQTTVYTYSCANGNGVNTANVTVNVIQPEVEPIAVSCAPSSSSGVTNQPITWSATVTGHPGPFSYVWSGTDGVTGSTASVEKVYSTVGTKTAQVKVTYAPQSNEPATPTTPSTPSCLPSGADVPAGYLCSADGMNGMATMPWGPCCSGVARIHCPALNEPAEATCVGSGGGGTNVSTAGTGVYELVMKRDTTSDPSLWADVAVRCVPSSTCNFECSAATAGRTCKTYECPAPNFKSFQAFRCEEVAAIPPPVTPPVTPQAEDGFSITTDCNGRICSTNNCSADPGGSGTSNQPGNPNSTEPNTPEAPTWGVTINLPGQCTVGPMCVGASIHQQALDCSTEFVRTCPYGCIAGQCVAPQPQIDLSISPAGVRRGESCTIQIAAQHVTSCSVSGPGLNQSLQVTQSGAVQSQSLVTPGIENSSTYTVSCDSPRGSISKSVQCVFLPVFRER